MSIGRVLMTGDTVGGVWTFTLELAEALGRRGIEVVLVTFGGHAADAQIAETASLPNVCLLESDFKLEWMEDPWADVEESGRWLMRLQDEYGPDLVHLNSFGHCHLAWKAPVLLTAHSCVLSWFQAVKGKRAPATWSRYEVLVGNALRAADAVTAPSRSMAVDLEAHYGVDARKCRAIPNGRVPGRFHASEKEPFVFTAGRLWDEAKNVAALGRVAPRLRWPVCIAGETRDTRVEGCRALGYLTQSEMVEQYARATIYAMPARYEPFGLSILEAALSRCALVLGDIPSLREIWADAALFVAPDDDAALEKTLRLLIENPGLRDRLSGRAYERALQYDTDTMVTAYLEAYANIRVAKEQACGS